MAQPFFSDYWLLKSSCRGGFDAGEFFFNFNFNANWDTSFEETEMNILMLLVPLALILSAFFVGLFLWGLERGQCDDLESPKHRMLFDKDEK